jgi:hypothetical protein
LKRKANYCNEKDFMKLKAFVLCSAIILSANFLGTERKVVTSVDFSSQAENELFDFETGNKDDSDFFSFHEADTLEEEKNQSRITRIKQWFIDQYNYFLLQCFIFYIDLKEKKSLYSSFLRSYYQSWYKKIRGYWKTPREDSHPR